MFISVLIVTDGRGTKTEKKKKKKKKKKKTKKYIVE